MGAFASIFAVMLIASLLSIGVTWFMAWIVGALFRVNPWLAAVGGVGPIILAIIIINGWRP